ncbi:putative quinate permease [Talaromyces islandicus]|uniref:Putative quinate permease n=1 Tax=Talaromyces islandicus TaxID=28573 RepID=A0A0U1MAX0_TALIS|nr:putative quinate permease [Talaromyces islandicus]
MGPLQLVEDRPTPKAVYNWRIYVLAAIASCGSNMIGYNRFIAGAFFGAIFTYALGYFVGRKWILVVASAIFALGAGLQIGATGSTGLGIMYAGRVLSGLGTDVASNIIPIYISELAPPAIRGRLVGPYELGWQIGGFGYGVEVHMESTNEKWVIPFAIQIIPSGLLFFGALWIRESPRWLFHKERREKAIKNLCWVRQLEESNIYVKEEVAAIDQALEEQIATVGIGFWKPFKAVAKSKAVLYRLFPGCMLFFWQNGSGINAINYYGPTIFTSIGVSSADVSWMTTIFSVIKAVMTIVWLLFLVDQLGRRNLLLSGALTGSISMWVIGSYIYVVRPDLHPTKKLNGGGIAAIFFFYLWTVCAPIAYIIVFK